MWLLNVKTKKLEEFVGKNIPKYAILSHTWGEKETTFKDIKRNGYVSGSTKIDGTCAEAQAMGLEYIWIDTFCINKSSSSELLEAISSMWDWYRLATICFAYLPDVPDGNNWTEENSAFSNSRWFTRGWTLQELIAPPVIHFYDSSWRFIGMKSKDREGNRFTAKLSKITGVPRSVLEYGPTTMRCSVAERMSWAAGRETTRSEDIAYSLLGIFGLNMIMTAVYGEGDRAFRRLQEEIMKTSSDESVFSWGFTQSVKTECMDSLFASSPADFATPTLGRRESLTVSDFKPCHFSLTKIGLHIEMKICSLVIVDGTALGLLNCSLHEGNLSEPLKNIALPLVSSKRHKNFFSRIGSSPPVAVSRSLFSESAESYVYIDTGRGEWACSYICNLEIKCRILGKDASSMVTEFYPPGWSGLLSGRLISCEKISLVVPPQTFIFLCKRDQQPNFAVWIDGEFEVANDFTLQPLNIQCRAALVPKGKTLAELILESKGGLAATLDWCKKLCFGNEELNISTIILDTSHDFQQMSCWSLTIDVEELGKPHIRNIPEIPRKEQFPVPQRAEIETWVTELTSPPKKKVRRSAFGLRTVASPLWGILSWF
ncbi:hypothetical protein V492_01609 [Pseudogymnoascus sp. VKM F-4246]|nr:hypothetical protein V492_01609 [Pseudogymnoascus sp. VKM F-4246]